MARKKSRTLADTTTDDLAKFVGERDALTMMNTRIPKKLLKKLRVYTVTNDTTIRQFVTDALLEKLERLGESIE